MTALIYAVCLTAFFAPSAIMFYIALTIEDD